MAGKNPVGGGLFAGRWSVPQRPKPTVATPAKTATPTPIAAPPASPVLSELPEELGVAPEVLATLDLPDAAPAAPSPFAAQQAALEELVTGREAFLNLLGDRASQLHQSITARPDPIVTTVSQGRPQLGRADAIPHSDETPFDDASILTVGEDAIRQGGESPDLEAAAPRLEDESVSENLPALVSDTDTLLWPGVTRAREADTDRRVAAMSDEVMAPPADTVLLGDTGAAAAVAGAPIHHLGGFITIADMPADAELYDIDVNTAASEDPRLAPWNRDEYAPETVVLPLKAGGYGLIRHLYVLAAIEDIWDHVDWTPGLQILVGQPSVHPAISLDGQADHEQAFVIRFDGEHFFVHPFTERTRLTVDSATVVSELFVDEGAVIALPVLAAQQMTWRTPALGRFETAPAEMADEAAAMDDAALVAAPLETTADTEGEAEGQDTADHFVELAPEDAAIEAAPPPPPVAAVEDPVLEPTHTPHRHIYPAIPGAIYAKGASRADLDPDAVVALRRDGGDYEIFHTNTDEFASVMNDIEWSEGTVVVLGSGDTATIDIADIDSLADRHAMLTFTRGEFLIQPYPGEYLFINGVAVGPEGQPLMAGEGIGFGDMHHDLIWVEPEAARAAHAHDDVSDSSVGSAILQPFAPAPEPPAAPISPLAAAGKIQRFTRVSDHVFTAMLSHNAQGIIPLPNGAGMTLKHPTDPKGIGGGIGAAVLIPAGEAHPPVVMQVTVDISRGKGHEKMMTDLVLKEILGSVKFYDGAEHTPKQMTTKELKAHPWWDWRHIADLAEFGILRAHVRLHDKWNEDTRPQVNVHISIVQRDIGVHLGAGTASGFSIERGGFWSRKTGGAAIVTRPTVQAAKDPETHEADWIRAVARNEGAIGLGMPGLLNPDSTAESTFELQRGDMGHYNFVKLPTKGGWYGGTSAAVLLGTAGLGTLRGFLPGFGDKHETTPDVAAAVAMLSLIHTVQETGRSFLATTAQGKRLTVERPLPGHLSLWMNRIHPPLRYASEHVDQRARERQAMLTYLNE